MSRPHLTLAVVALASLVVTACSSSPTGPSRGIRTPDSINADSVNVQDSSSFRGWIGSNG